MLSSRQCRFQASGFQVSSVFEPAHVLGWSFKFQETRPRTPSLIKGGGVAQRTSDFLHPLKRAGELRSIHIAGKGKPCGFFGGRAGATSLRVWERTGARSHRISNAVCEAGKEKRAGKLPYFSCPLGDCDVRFGDGVCGFLQWLFFALTELRVHRGLASAFGVTALAAVHAALFVDERLSAVGAHLTLHDRAVLYVLFQCALDADFP